MPLLDALIEKPPVECVAAIHFAAKEVESEPASFVFIIGLVLEQGGSKHAANVLSLDELGIRGGAPYFLHRGGYGSALRHDDSKAGGLVAAMRIPVPVKTTESCRSHWLVNGSEALRPRISLGDISCEICQRLRKGGI